MVKYSPPAPLYDQAELSAIELYNREYDPHETRNIADTEEAVEVRRELAAQLADGWRAALPR